MQITVRPIHAHQTHELRQRILRPTQPIEEMVYPGDDDAETMHLGAFDGERLVGIATIYHEGFADDPQPGDWRLRGMAVEDGQRGGGVGSKILGACAQHMIANGGRRLWCNARTPACRFYEKHGLKQHGEIFDAVAIGPHVVMVGDVKDLLNCVRP